MYRLIIINQKTAHEEHNQMKGENKQKTIILEKKERDKLTVVRI